MPNSPSSSAQAAREGVAGRLKEIRLDAGLTCNQLASQCGWHHAKTSRIENAKTPPSTSDINLRCRACGVESEAADLIAQSRNAESMYTEWRRKVRTGLKQLQDSYVPLFQSQECSGVLLDDGAWTASDDGGYATALLSSISHFQGAPDDVAEAVRARLRRSHILHESGHRFLLLMEESALRYQVGDAEAMAAQLGHLLTVGALPSVALGIIPFSAGERAIWPQETFHIYDDTLVSVELLSARVKVSQPSEIALYLRAFDELRHMAVYGHRARALVVNAIDVLK